MILSAHKSLILAVFSMAAMLMIGQSETNRLGASAPAAAVEPPTAGGPATMRRLNEAQYVRSIEDIFGPGIKIPGRFDPPVRQEGLLAIGDGTVVVSSSGLEQYDLRAREISAQVMSESRRKSLMPCAPQSSAAFDKACANAFIGKFGRLLYRRALDDDEIASIANVASVATTRTGDFYRGLEFALARLLTSPNFIFRIEQTEADPTGKGWRLTDYALATRISFLLWDAPPDGALLDAAASGALNTKAGLESQVDRLIASPRFEQGVRAFFSDMFGYDQFNGLSKDQSIYPIYTSRLARDAKEQALRTIVDALVVNKGDYRDLFTSRKTFMNRNLGGLYQVPVSAAGVEGWAPHIFSADDHRAGLLTLAAFLMLDATHEGRSSPTIRGKSVRELFLCQIVPPPPGNVDFALVQNIHDPLHKTARDRLTIHRQNPVCAGCHALTDPIGLAMEHYDGVGNYRSQENGAAIDTSGDLDGKAYRDAVELGKALHDSESVPSCAAQRVYEYGVGRPALTDETDWLAYLTRQFADARYMFPALMREVATSRAFRAASVKTVASN